MVSALGRYFRAIGYLLTGRIDSARKELSANPYVIQATFDRVITEKKARIQQYKDAVARLIAQQEKKMVTVRSLSDDVAKLEQLKQGAAAKARQVVADLKARGMSEEAIKHDEGYLRCMTAFNDFTSTGKEKADRIAELEADVRNLGENITGHKVQLQQLLRELDKLKEESAATVADVITAKEEKEIADMISGISEDRSSKELEELREMRGTLKANARVSREVAGTDSKRQEAECLEYARTSVATSEFDKLIGLAGESDRKEESAPQKSAEVRLPEA